MVNPNQLGCEFPSKALAGVGVAFYLLANLSSHRSKLNKSVAKMTQYLDLVALGTYADVASLDFNNRILVDAGVKRIQSSQCRSGILASGHEWREQCDCNKGTGNQKIRQW